MPELYIDQTTGDLIIEGMSPDEVERIAGDLLGTPEVPAACDYRDRWGFGPWRDEPDRVDWDETETGLHCMVRRAYHGALCGYVGVHRGHELYGLHYSRLNVLPLVGDLNYSQECDGDAENGVCHVPEPGQPDDLYWYGFDAATDPDDYVPLYPNGDRRGYVTIEVMKHACEYLAHFLAGKPGYWLKPGATSRLT